MQARSKTSPALRKELQDIAECEECLEADTIEHRENWSWRSVSWFFVRHMIYSGFFLKLDSRLRNYLLFTFRGILRSKTGAYLFYFACSAAVEMLVRKVQQSHSTCLSRNY